MGTEKGLMDFSAANALDTGERTKSVPPVAARAVCLLNSLGSRWPQGQCKSPVEQRSGVNEALICIRLVKQSSDEVMAPACGREYQAVARLDGIACLDASCSWIGTEQGIYGVPRIGMMKCAGGENVGLQFDQLGKELSCHSVARPLHQVGGCCVLVGIGLALRRRVGETVRIDVVRLRHVELTREEVHHTYKVARRSSDSISNGNSSIVTRR